MRSIRSIALAAAVVMSAILPAHAQDSEPILHEYVAPDVKENIDLSSTDASGQLPAAIRTPSGTITPPDVRTTPDPRQVYQKPGGDSATISRSCSPARWGSRPMNTAT